jgi:hypothetical protein
MNSGDCDSSQATRGKAVLSALAATLALAECRVVSDPDAETRRFWTA